MALEDWDSRGCFLWIQSCERLALRR
jgi:hypothetical protein